MPPRLFLQRSLLLCALVLCGRGSTWAQTAADGPVISSIAGHPVEMRLSVLGGMQYSLDGSSLDSYREFEDIIAPLGDYEATRLLKSSESSKDLSRIFGWPGFAALAVGVTGLLTAPSNEQTGFWITAIAGGISMDIGAFLGVDAESAKFNCVQRYNRFAYGKEQILPKAPQDEKTLLPVGAAGTSASPVTQESK